MWKILLDTASIIGADDPDSETIVEESKPEIKEAPKPILIENPPTESNTETLKKKRKRNKKKTNLADGEDQKNEIELQPVQPEIKEEKIEVIQESPEMSQSNDGFTDTLKKRKRNRNKNKQKATSQEPEIIENVESVEAAESNEKLPESPNPLREAPSPPQKSESRKNKNKKRSTSILDELQERKEREQQEARIALRNEIAKREMLLEKIDMVLNSKKSEAIVASQQQSSLKEITQLAHSAAEPLPEPLPIDDPREQLVDKIEQVLGVTKLEIKNAQNQQAFVGRLEDELAKVQVSKEKYLRGDMSGESSTSAEPKIPEHIEKLAKEIRDISKEKPKTKEEIIKEIETRDLLMSEINKVLHTTKSEIAKVQKQQKIITNLETELNKIKENEFNDQLSKLGMQIKDDEVEDAPKPPKKPSASASLLDALMANVGKLKDAQVLKQQQTFPKENDGAKIEKIVQSLQMAESALKIEIKQTIEDAQKSSDELFKTMDPSKVIDVVKQITTQEALKTESMQEVGIGSVDTLISCVTESMKTDIHKKPSPKGSPKRNDKKKHHDSKAPAQKAENVAQVAEPKELTLIDSTLAKPVEEIVEIAKPEEVKSGPIEPASAQNETNIVSQSATELKETVKIEEPSKECAKVEASPKPQPKGSPKGVKNVNDHKKSPGAQKKNQDNKTSGALTTKEKSPAKETIHVKEKSPTKETICIKEKSPTKETICVKEKSPTKETIRVKEKTPSKDLAIATPVKSVEKPAIPAKDEIAEIIPTQIQENVEENVQLEQQKAEIIKVDDKITIQPDLPKAEAIKPVEATIKNNQLPKLNESKKNDKHKKDSPKSHQKNQKQHKQPPSPIKTHEPKAEDKNHSVPAVVIPEVPQILKPSMADMLKNAPDPVPDEIQAPDIIEKLPEAVATEETIIQSLADAQLPCDVESTIDNSSKDIQSEQTTMEESMIMLEKPEAEAEAENCTNPETNETTDSKNVEGSGFVSPVKESDAKPLKTSPPGKSRSPVKNIKSAKPQASKTQATSKPAAVSKPRPAPLKTRQTVSKSPTKPASSIVAQSDAKDAPVASTAVADQTVNGTKSPSSPKKPEIAPKPDFLKHGSKPSSSPSRAPQKTGNVSPSIHKPIPHTPSPAKAPVTNKVPVSPQPLSTQTTTAKPKPAVPPRPANTKPTTAKTSSHKTPTQKASVPSKATTLADAVNFSACLLT